MDSNSKPYVVQPVASCYTYYAILVPDTYEQYEKIFYSKVRVNY
jgi:hypothetical protein